VATAPAVGTVVAGATEVVAPAGDVGEATGCVVEGPAVTAVVVGLGVVLVLVVVLVVVVVVVVVAPAACTPSSPSEQAVPRSMAPAVRATSHLGIRVMAGPYRPVRRA
jgi:hypothetical protein